ncbi:hypothetical protein DLAC_06739 [Tieghemostelium lacteum]|uniref:Serine aminopeptidase S33 domain-containing protein n=1 Tax=Tieghemostelium lacteum TaxID=361077 RepID=A0A151ZFU1_TIELA|nr:hypothetical protein DLAC_06739 [Tieghemostelium lacteum]|eukprot:KYQ92734.1 hypothetical protein DLAC_06739 [Tieghemostelium lacteum]
MSKSKIDNNVVKSTNGWNKCILISSVVVGLLSVSIVAFFIYFVSNALLYFPWWKGNKPGSGNPLEKFNIEYDDIEFLGFDTNQTIRGWWVPALASKDQQITMIAVHGSGRDRYEFIEQIQVWHHEGISTLIYDSIDGIGASDGLGSGVGYSIRESKDVRAAVRIAKSKYPLHSKKIILTGMSLGGGSVIVAASKDNHLIDGVISESSYLKPSVVWRHNIYRYLGEDISKFFKFIKPFDQVIPTNPPGWLVDMIVELTIQRILASSPNLSRDDTPENCIKQIQKPILILHGTKDPVCPYSHALELFAGAQEPKELWTIESDHHTTAVHSAGTDRYLEKLRSFIKRI